MRLDQTLIALHTRPEILLIKAGSKIKIKSPHQLHCEKSQLEQSQRPPCTAEGTPSEWDESARVVLPAWVASALVPAERLEAQRLGEVVGVAVESEGIGGDLTC
jgi:hypothetical protein